MVFNLGGEFFALGDRCPHKGGSLSQGKLTGLVEVVASPASTATAAAARSCAVPGTPGNSTCAPAARGATPSALRARNYAVSVEPGARVVEGPYVAETFPVTVENDYVVVEV